MPIISNCRPKILSICFSCLLSSYAGADSIALVAARIIDGVSAKPLPATTVVVENDKITAIGQRDIIPEHATVIDLGDATLLPGFIDSHTHPFIHGEDYQATALQHSSAYKSLRALASVQKLLTAGWTSMRIMGDADTAYGPVDLKHAINQGLFVGPRLSVAPHYLSITGGGGDVNYYSHEQAIIPDGLIVDGPEEIRKAIRQEAKYGADWIKVLVTGAFHAAGNNPKNVHFSPEEIAALMAEANRQGLPVAAHAHATEGIKQAIKAGARSIEHGTYLDDEAITLMKKHGTFFVPTIYVGDYFYEEEKTLKAQAVNDEYYDNYRAIFLKMIGKAHKAGVKIAVGVDLGDKKYPAHVYVREMAALVEAGLSPMAAIQAGTRVGAELLGWEDTVGSLEQGKLADIVAVAGNPLDNMQQLEQVKLVMLNGQLVLQP
ncbi:amidohydrolase family protein [Dasania sp. GY-MA-18]|uniref:Amidohydrolase family protein n=1 Tax=Dasania phycosphaerae TaxID=2950436 RepID=A0A9J6RMT9_9GAMM|nr:MULTISPECIES: amidohydrolase family protein [Dasania]MCR8923612.1 amidohydrolase family protein [Dasania sp. GY-MA-18]MCZ0866046.1 amidohydrolase family protein [Dasania phycosphaerae]MCZ0869770.1 amidohydrolase family protein [Dasania phycosphaerae]